MNKEVNINFYKVFIKFYKFYVTEKMKYLKVLSVNPSKECLKKEKCEYCYLKNKKNDISYSNFNIKLLELMINCKPETIALSYNEGFDQSKFNLLIVMASLYCKVSVTIQPEIIFKLNYNIWQNMDYITLSLNSSNYKNYNLSEFRKIILRKNDKLKIGINFLILDEIQLKEIASFIEENKYNIEQFHFLIPKKYKISLKLSTIIVSIKALKLMFPDLVYVDECLKTLINKEPCNRSGNLLCLNNDGSVTRCSFDDKELDWKELEYLEIQEENITSCPFLEINNLEEGR